MASGGKDMNNYRNIDTKMKVRRPSEVRVLTPSGGEVSSPLAPLRPGPPNFWPHPLSLTTRALCRFKAHCTGGCATTVQKPRPRSARQSSQKPDSDKFVAEGLFRARLDAPSRGALGGVVLWGGGLGRVV